MKFEQRLELSELVNREEGHSLQRLQKVEWCSGGNELRCLRDNKVRSDLELE